MDYVTDPFEKNEAVWWKLARKLGLLSAIMSKEFERFLSSCAGDNS